MTFLVIAVGLLLANMGVYSVLDELINSDTIEVV